MLVICICLSIYIVFVYVIVTGYQFPGLYNVVLFPILYPPSHLSTQRWNKHYDIANGPVVNYILLKHTKNLSHYDFQSDISVNILGHIFENSLSEIEEIQNQISGEGKSVSKRKKDGVFYTPSYITKYIVENTVGKLCKEKRIELEFNESEFVKDRKGRKQNTLKKLSNQLRAVKVIGMEALILKSFTLTKI